MEEWYEDLGSALMNFPGRCLRCTDRAAHAWAGLGEDVGWPLYMALRGWKNVDERHEDLGSELARLVEEHEDIDRPGFLVNQVHIVEGLGKTAAEPWLLANQVQEVHVEQVLPVRLAGVTLN